MYSYIYVTQKRREIITKALIKRNKYLRLCGTVTRVSSQLLNWFNFYLSNRKQRFVVSNSSSSWPEISAGVPQGSILSPTLTHLYKRHRYRY